MAIFDDVVRTELSPAHHGESYRSYLNRSARPEFELARTRIEKWFDRLCADLRPGVLDRLRSEDNQQFIAGFWELYLHELFIRLGYDIVCEPTVGNGRKIDFLLQRGESAFYVEATIARKSVAEQAADARRNRIYRELDKIKSTNFMLGITIEAAGGSDMANIGTLRARLEEWLATLEPDEAERKWDTDGEGPTVPWTDGTGWSLVFEAFPSKPELRGTPVSRPLGMFMDETGGLIEDEKPLRRALYSKRPSRYGDDLRLPYVVAINEDPFEFGDAEFHRMNVLFGHLAVQVGPGRETRSVRQPDGFWRGPGALPRNRRLAAVLITSHVSPWTVDRSQLDWWDNPFANSPVPEDAIPDVVHRRQLVIDDKGAGELSRLQAALTPATVLDS